MWAATASAPSAEGSSNDRPGFRRRTLIKQGVIFALALGIWLTPIPAGLTSEAWHLFAIFSAAILSVILNAFPLLTAAMMAVAAAVLTRTVDPNKAFAGFANASVLLVIVAFLVAYSVVKSGLGRRISLLVVSVFGRSTLGLGYSIFLTDAVIAPAFPSNTARGGVLFPIVLSLAQNAGSKPEDESTRRLGGYLMFCGMASLAVSSALWLTAASTNPIGVSVVAQYGLEIDFGSWLLAASVPTLTAILLLPLVLYRLYPPGVTATPDAPAAAREELRSMGSLSRDERIVAVAFAVMVTGWVMAGTLNLNLTAVAFGGLAALLATTVLPRRAPRDHGPHRGRHRPTGEHPVHVPLARGALRAEQPAKRAGLHELCRRPADRPAGRHPLADGLRGAARALRADALHVRQPVVTGPGSPRRLPRCRHSDRRAGAPHGVLAPVRQRLFLGDHPQGGSQNVIFVGAGYLTQGELYRLGALTTIFCVLVFLIVGTPWLLFVTR